MPPVIASVIYSIGILGLFYLDRKAGPKLSPALWIPAIWLFLISSRPVSMWLGMSPNMSQVNATAAYVEGSPIDRNVFFLLIFTAFAVLASRNDRVGPLLQRNFPLLLYLSFCALSIVWSDFPLVAFKRWIKAVGDVGMVLVLLTEVNPLDVLKRILTRLGFILFPLSVLFIKYYPDLGRRLTMSWTEEATGVATQKNELGLICMLFGVFFLWMFISVYRDRKDPSRQLRLLAYGSIIGIIIWLLSQCDSTTSITGLISAGVVTLIASRPSHKRAIIHLSAASVLGLALIALFFDPGGGMVEALGKNPTLTGRTQIWGLVLAMHTNPLVGTGFESFWLGQRLLKMRTALPNFPINEAHDGYLEVYLNLGWVGISLIALLVITAYKRVSSGIRENPATASLFLGFLLCTLFYAFTEAAFRLMNPSWFFFLIVTMYGSQEKIFTCKLPNKLTHRVGSANSKKTALAAQDVDMALR